MEQDLINIFNDVEPISNPEIIIFNDSFIHEEIVEEESTKYQQYVKNFEQLMNLYPREHPSHIHAVMMLANNNYEEAEAMLNFVTGNRGSTNSTVASTSSNLTELESNISQQIEELKKSVIPEPVAKPVLEPVTDTDVKIVELVPYEEPIKPKRGTIPASTHLKRVYKDTSSKFLKIKKVK